MTPPAEWMAEKLGRATQTLLHYAGATLAGIILLAAIALAYGVSHIGINTSTADMFSTTLDWHKDFRRFKTSFPQLVDNVLVVIDSTSAEDAEVLQNQLVQKLSARTDLFDVVLAPETMAFFQQNGFLYLSEIQLQTRSDQLARIQPMLARLAATPDIAGLAALLEEAMSSPVAPENEMRAILAAMGDALHMNAQGENFRISWRSILESDGEAEHGVYRRIVLLAPKLDFAIAQPRKASIQMIRNQIQSLEVPPTTTLRLTGSVAMQYEEQQTVAKGMAAGAAATFLLVIGVLFLALRSWRFVAASLLTLLCGLALTIAFAAFWVGYLNLISVAFAVLYIGLGIDFAIHYCLRYRELLDEGMNPQEAVPATSLYIGGSLVLCAITTSAGFYSFIGTDFIGMAELGLISGTGMFFSLLISLILLPVLLKFMGPGIRAGEKTLGNPLLSAIGEWAACHKRGVLLATLLIIAGAGWASIDTRFDSNPLNLRDPNSESVSTYVELMRDGDSTPMTLSVLAPGPALNSLKAELVKLPVVKGTRSFSDLVPDDQGSKLAIIADLQLLLGDIGPINPLPVEVQRDVSALSALQIALEKNGDSPLKTDFDKLAGHLAEWKTGFEALPHAEKQQRLESLSHSFFDNLSREWLKILKGLQAVTVTSSDLPEPLSSLWRTDTDLQRLEVVPRDDLSSNQAIARFVQTVSAVAPHSTGLPAVQFRGGQTVIKALLQAFATALAALIVILLLLTHSLRNTFTILAPLLLAALMTCAATVLLDVPFNFANVITLPLLLGIGVDNGIHMVHRHQHHAVAGKNLLATATARAILYSSLTTVCSFGTLAFSNHPGTASMGLLLTIGMILSVVSALFLAPALMHEQRPSAA